MRVSVLITTYNRSALLQRALASVLAQDYRHLDVTVIDDCSTDETPNVMASLQDERVRYVRNEVNVGANGGDLAIIKRFLAEHCTGDAFVYLCDDDYWPSKTLISRQVEVLQAQPSLAFVHGGMAHCYPKGFAALPVPNESYVTYSFLDDARTQLFWGTLYPAGFLSGRIYLRLFAQDPKNRNIVIGATLFRADKFKASGVMERINGVRWQGGYAILAGAALQGDVYYLDEPCLMVAVERKTASQSGTQADNFRECLASIDAAFTPLPADAEWRDLRIIMMKSVLKMFLCNKISNRAHWFETHPLGDLSDLMGEEIKGAEFIGEMSKRGVPLSDDNRQLIEWSDMLDKQGMMQVTWLRGVLAMAS